jgi:hypothetical protein
MPAKQSGLIDKAVKEFGFRKTDINGRGKQGKAFDLGAVEYAEENHRTTIKKKQTLK